MSAPRLRDLPTTSVPALEISHPWIRDIHRMGGFRVALGVRARLLGLAHLDLDEAGPGLLIPRCSCVHTFGMRFPLELVFLDRDARVCSVRRAVPACRLAWDRRADSVLELPVAASDR